MLARTRRRCDLLVVCNSFLCLVDFGFLRFVMISTSFYPQIFVPRLSLLALSNHTCLQFGNIPHTSVIYFCICAIQFGFRPLSAGRI